MLDHFIGLIKHAAVSVLSHSQVLDLFSALTNIKNWPNIERKKQQTI